MHRPCVECVLHQPLIISPTPCFVQALLELPGGKAAMLRFINLELCARWLLGDSKGWPTIRQHLHLCAPGSCCSRSRDLPQRVPIPYPYPPPVRFLLQTSLHRLPRFGGASWCSPTARCCKPWWSSTQPCAGGC